VNALLDHALRALLLDMALDPLDLLGGYGAHVISYVGDADLLKQRDQGLVF
jgi:hypothetical protein